MRLGQEQHWLGRIVALSEAGGAPRVRVQLLREGRFLHPAAPRNANGERELVIDETLLTEIKANFDAGVKGFELPSNMNHDDPKFTKSKGWLKSMAIERGEEGLTLWGEVEPTSDVAEDIKHKRIKYVSPEIVFNEQHPELRKKITAMRGFAWTNIPYIKNMRPATVLNFAEVDIDEDPDSSVGDPLDRQHLDITAAKDPDAKQDGLPEQCRSCSLLYDGHCPFQGIPVKMAAAGEGTCPRYEAADSSRDYPDNPTEVQMTEQEKQELMGRLQAAEARAEQAEKTVALLSEQGGSALQQIAALQAERQAERTAVALSECLRSGRILPAEMPLVERLLRKVRGESGTVTLSEVSGRAEVNLDETSLEDDLLSFINNIEPRVALTEGAVRVAERRFDNSSVDLAEKANARANELRQKGYTGADVYAVALREVASELSKGGTSFQRPTALEAMR